MASTLAPTDRSRLRRAHERGAFDRASIDAILDATMLCHVAYAIDGAPSVTPTLFWREGDHVYWHGSSASRMLRASAGAEVAFNVCLLDGFVMARSGFKHSANYRSVTLFGRAEPIEDPDEATARLKTFFEAAWPGRWDALRPMTEAELKATTVLRLEIKEGAAKVRAGGPNDPDEDRGLPIWAGVIPVRRALDAPAPDGTASEPPPHIVDFRTE